MTRSLRTGWPPALLATALIAGLIWHSDVGGWVVLGFLGYTLAFLVVPGTILWRALSGRRERWFIEDVACGTGLACACELLTYLLCRMVGLPHLVLLWPVIAVAIVLPLGSWRELLRPAVTRRLPVGVSWSLSALVVTAFVWIARTLWTRPMTDDSLRFPHVDEPYHLALVGELKHHWPPQTPMVDGERLQYHWFVHADMAASSWITGIEPVLLEQRLAIVPMVVVVLLGSAALATRLSGSPWWGLTAPALLTLVVGSDVAPATGEAFLTAVLTLSPTTTFAQLLLIPLIGVVLTLLGDDPPQRRWWVAFALLAIAISGAKATVLPVLIGGCAAVIVVRAAMTRRLARRPLAMLAVLGGAFQLSRVLVYGTDSRGLVLDPLETAHLYAAALGVRDPGAGATWATLVVVVLGQLLVAAGVVGIFVSGRWRDPRAQFLVGSALAGVVATYLFSAPGWSQVYFLRITPVLMVVPAAWGASLLVKGDAARRTWAIVLGGCAAGAVLAWQLDRLSSDRPFGAGLSHTVVEVVRPTTVAAVAVLALTAAFALSARRWQLPRGSAWLFAVAVLAGLGLPHSGRLAESIVDDPLPALTSGKVAGQATIGAEGVPVARWLRDHSETDDLVATNQHCRSRVPGQCDTRMFWLSAYAERHVLVEGWAYSNSNLQLAVELDQPACCLPFHDPQRLTDNDAVFVDPSPHSLDVLRDRYGVRWLVVDRRLKTPIQRLAQLADVRLDRGAYVVLELRG